MGQQRPAPLPACHKNILQTARTRGPGRHPATGDGQARTQLEAAPPARSVDSSPAFTVRDAHRRANFFARKCVPPPPLSGTPRLFCVPKQYRGGEFVSTQPLHAKARLRGHDIAEESQVRRSAIGANITRISAEPTTPPHLRAGYVLFRGVPSNSQTGSRRPHHSVSTATQQGTRCTTGSIVGPRPRPYLREKQEYLYSNRTASPLGILQSPKRSSPRQTKNSVGNAAFFFFGKWTAQGLSTGENLGCGGNMTPHSGSGAFVGPRNEASCALRVQAGLCGWSGEWVLPHGKEL